MKKLTLICGAAMALSSAPVLAQDDTSGGKFVVGAVIGVDSIEAESGGVSGSSEDLLVGAVIGYDFEFESGMVLGVEAEFTDSSIGFDFDDVLVAGDRASVNAGRDIYVGLRAGMRTGPNGLLYAKVGYTNASVEGEYDDGIAVVSDSVDRGGFRIGAGGEIDLGGEFAVRLEYRYSNYGDVDTAGLGLTDDVTLSRHQGVLTLLGKF
uniref:outer membrane protein n=1 Tax=uncultured Erythrobacter sp. TaxID=263913 RepID=UPI002618550B|nr:porin family protein [uncultured Erythrobacter sp.]